MSARSGLVVAACAIAGVVAALGCSDYSEPASGGVCASSSYSGGGSHAVACPGVAGCTCAAPGACCLGAIDSRAGACVDPRECAGLVLSCDGPEDCGGGVCCLTSTGSSCAASSACTGQWLCRGDSECVGSPNGGSCLPADYGTKGVNTGLDGIIGLCQH